MDGAEDDGKRARKAAPRTEDAGERAESAAPAGDRAGERPRPAAPAAAAAESVTDDAEEQAESATTAGDRAEERGRAVAPSTGGSRGRARTAAAPGNAAERGEGRTLAALGLAEAPREHPLLYPGAWPRESGVLDGDRLLPLDRPVHDDRTPVLAIGSNASPAQLRDKMAEFGIASPIPMVRARVTGLDIGVSAHVSRMGYVSASPVRAPGVVRELFVLWLDAEQLAVIDASEGVPMAAGNFDRAWLPAPDVRVEAAGAVLRGAYVYVNRHGVLRDGGGAPRRHPGEQRALLTELLGGSARLRELFGTSPEEFSARARGDRRLCERGTRLFAEEERVTASGLERYVRSGRTDGRLPWSRPPTSPTP